MRQRRLPGAPRPVEDTVVSPIPVIFIDTSDSFRRLVARLLERHFAADIVLAGDYSGWPVTGARPNPSPQAVLLGLGSNGLVDPQLLATLRHELPEAPVVVLGHLDDAPYREAALAAGAAAFVAKDTLDTTLVPTLRQVVAP